MGNCFTLFHRSHSDVLSDIAIQSGLSQSPVIRGNGEAVDLDIAEQPFHPNEVVRLKVNFSRDEYTTLNDPVSGYVVIHDDEEAPPVREKSFVIYPGFYYEFYLTKQSEHLLPYPYSTDCVTYEQEDIDEDSDEDINEYLYHPLSKENCLIGCMAQKTMNSCLCWPPELPFVTGSDPEAEENQMKLCDWNVGPTEGNITKPENTSWFRFCFTQNEQQCNQNCKSDCE